MENKESKYVKIIREICKEEGIQLSSYSGDWAFLLEKEEKRVFILGYQFGLNPSSVREICSDKNIASEVLKQAGVPSVYHSCYMSPALQGYIGVNGNWKALLNELEEKKVLVCKDCCGTGGNQVYLVRNARELEGAAAQIFAVAQSMAVCAYEEILSEYRLVILDGTIRLAFTKMRPSLVGDGSSTIGQLFAAKLLQGEASGFVVPEQKELSRVLAKDDVYLLNWKHNLGQGAQAKELTIEELPEETKTLAAAVHQALRVRFASVDVILTKDGWKVLEVNSGVMMEHFAGTNDTYYQKAKSIYKDAVLKMLEEAK